MFLERKIAAVMHGEKERHFQAIGMACSSICIFAVFYLVYVLKVVGKHYKTLYVHFINIELYF